MIGWRPSTARQGQKTRHTVTVGGETKILLTRIVTLLTYSASLKRKKEKNLYIINGFRYQKRLSFSPSAEALALKVLSVPSVEDGFEKTGMAGWSHQSFHPGI